MFFIMAAVAMVLIWAAFIAGILIEHRRRDAKRTREMERALEAVLLFYSGGGWGPESQAMWLELTGTDDATTKNLCNFVRKAYGKEFQLPSQKR
jgi:hypothetical protein